MSTCKSDFHTIKKLKLQVRVSVFSVFNVGELNYAWVDTWKKLEETRRVHVHAKLGVWLICECGLYAGVYGNKS